MVIDDLSDALRRRLWSTLRDHNEPIYYSTPDNPNWVHNSDVLGESEPTLSKLLGIDRYQDGMRRPHDLHTFILKGDPALLFDVLEIVFRETPSDGQFSLQRDLNDAFVDFACPWRMTDGLMFRVDSDFLELEVLSHTSEALAGVQFKGASDEFKIARDHLTDGSVRDAITYAAHSVESTLKAALSAHNGDATTLLSQFSKEFMDDIPSQRAKAVVKALQGPALLRNELGGHGQGAEILDAPRPYAELAVHMAAAANHFVVEQYLRKNPLPLPVAKDAPLSAPTVALDDEIPF